MVGNFGWHHAVMTINRSATETLMYFDGLLVDTDLDLPSSVAESARIGDKGVDRESNASLGLCSTYDHVLSSGEVSQLYNDFLADEYVPFPFAALSGIVFSTSGTPLEGANVLVYDHQSDRVLSSNVTSSGGNYLAVFPREGGYSIYTTKSGVAGGRAAPVTVTSGGAVTVHGNT